MGDKAKWLWKIRADAWRDKKLPPLATKAFLQFTDLAVYEPSEFHKWPHSSISTNKLAAASVKQKLCERNYVYKHPESPFGSPPTDHFSIHPERIKGSGTAPFKGSGTAPNKGNRFVPNHISNSLREECKPNGSNGSLRSEKRGELNAASPEKRVLDGKAASPQDWSDPRKREAAWKAAGLNPSQFKKLPPAATAAGHQKAKTKKTKTLLRKK